MTFPFKGYRSTISMDAGSGSESKIVYVRVGETIEIDAEAYATLDDEEKRLIDDVANRSGLLVQLADRLCDKIGAMAFDAFPAACSYTEEQFRELSRAFLSGDGLGKYQEKSVPKPNPIDTFITKFWRSRDGEEKTRRKEKRKAGQKGWSPSGSQRLTDL